MSKLKKIIVNDMKTMMKNKDSNSLRAIRMLLATIKQKEIDNRVQLDDAEIIVIINKMLKQHRDSINQFSQAGRDDLVVKEKSELKVIMNYMPKQKTQAEIITDINQAITNTSASSISDMGKVMAVLKTKLNAKADMSLVSKLVKDALL